MRNGTNGRARRMSGCILLAMIAVLGCGKGDLESPTATKLRGLANFYLDYAAANRGAGPASEQVLKKHLKSQPGFMLQSNGLDASTIDSAFVSDRDGEPFVVLYGTAITAIKGDSTQVLAHEKSGKNGKRLVAYASTKVDLVDDSRLKELMAAKP